MKDFSSIAPFPASRPRRSRRQAFSRRLVRENTLSVDQLIQPVFLIEGDDVRQPVPSMPGIERVGISALLREAENLHSLGVPAIVLFPVPDADTKSNTADNAWNDDGLVQRAIRELKKNLPDLGVITDVALDPYTSHGQDGLMDDTGYIVNDETVEVLVKQALSHAEAGADIVGPSDMMDGRVGAIRQALETNGFIHTEILAYAAKFASVLYSPFRDAVGSTGNLAGADKFTYQIDTGNGDEALREIAADLSEGADMVMIKPGLPYLDIVRRAKETFGVPTFAYHVSGEYSMIKAAAANGWIDEKAVTLETMMAFRRAGCDAVLTYCAADVARWLQNTDGA